MIGLTLTCRCCDRREFFAGNLREAHNAAGVSPNWTHDARGFLICTACAEQKQRSEEAA